MRQITDSIETTGDIGVNRGSFLRHLRAENLSPRTLETYGESIRQFSAFLTESGMPEDVANISREHVEAFVAHLLGRWKATTANNRYRGLQSFFNWLVDEGEIRESPMARMKPPRVPEEPPNILRESELRALLATCEKGSEFEDRRDVAILRVLIDTGGRRAEIANICWNPNDDDNNDVDLDRGLLRVVGKGRRERLLPIGNKTTRALDRYIRRRAQHPAAR